MSFLLFPLWPLSLHYSARTLYLHIALTGRVGNVILIRLWPFSVPGMFNKKHIACLFGMPVQCARATMSRLSSMTVGPAAGGSSCRVGSELSSAAASGG